MAETKEERADRLAGDALRRAYRLGDEAWQFNLDPRNNLFPEGTAEHAEWARGFAEAGEFDGAPVAKRA